VAAAQKAKADATREAEKADRAAASQAEQYSRKMEDLSVAIEVQKVRATEGEKAADLYAAANQAVRNGRMNSAKRSVSPQQS
jgi:CRISPR/Cas system-associated endonuclease Cas1